jgi:hypothetical protein
MKELIARRGETFQGIPGVVTQELIVESAR